MFTIAVSGTHGKTTTTAMIGHILKKAGFDPTVVVGSKILGENTNFLAGKSKYLVVEACEYRRSFLNLSPSILVITNIEADHLDYYKDIEDIKSAFRELTLKVPADGFVICNPNDENIADVIKDIKAKVIDCQEFFDKNLKLKVPGVHNKKDASCAMAVASILNIQKEDVEKSLAEFPGTWRRFEYKGKLSSGAIVYDDYAHHPVEIYATLLGFRELYKKEEGYRIIVLFQPHLFSRTKALLPEFAESLREADVALILPIYFAREENDGSISSFTLAEKIGTKAKAFSDFAEAEEYIRGMDLHEKDILVTMGAGEAYKIGDALLSN